MPNVLVARRRHARDARRSAGSDAMAPSLMAKRRARLLVYAMIGAFGLLGYGARARGASRVLASRAWSRSADSARDSTRRPPRASAADASPPSLAPSVSLRHWQRSSSPCTTQARPARTSSRTATRRFISREAFTRENPNERDALARDRVVPRLAEHHRASHRARLRRARPSPNVHRGRFLRPLRREPRPSSSRKRRRSPRRRPVRGSRLGAFANRPRTSATPPPTRSSGDRTPRDFPQGVDNLQSDAGGCCASCVSAGPDECQRVAAGSVHERVLQGPGKSSRRRTSMTRGTRTCASRPAPSTPNSRSTSPRDERRGRAGTGTGTGTETGRRRRRPSATLRRVCTR